jgi:hypothetical protein
MKSSLRWFTLAVCSTLAVVGCKKNETAETEVARGAEQKLPPQEQVEQAPGAAAVPAPSDPPAPSSPPVGEPAITASATAPAADQAAYEAWFKKNKLDLGDAKMLDADPDEDGFSNREEFLADSDPNDKNSRPGIHKGIRLKEYREVRLPFELEAIEGDKARIKRTDQPEAKAVTVKHGDTIKGLPYKVLEVEEKEDFDKAGAKYTMSRVALENTSTKEKVVLMKDLPSRTGATSAVLVSPDGKTTLTVHRGDVFSWPAEQSSRYKVIDLSQDQVVLLQMDTNKTWTIPKQ